MSEEIPWTFAGHDEAWWRELMQVVRATEQQLRFAVCRFAGMTQTRSARIAGYAADEGERARKAGSEVAKSNGVTVLLALARADTTAADLPANAKGIMTRDEAAQLLSDLARTPDPSVSLRATEALLKQLPDVNERGVLDDGYAEWRIARDFLTFPGGAVAYASLHHARGIGIDGLSLLHDVVLLLKRDDPEFYEMLRRRSRPITLASLDRHLSDSEWQLEAREKLWREIGIDLKDILSVGLIKPVGAEAA